MFEWTRLLKQVEKHADGCPETNAIEFVVFVEVGSLHEMSFRDMAQAVQAGDLPCIRNAEEAIARWYEISEWLEGDDLEERLADCFRK